jgi:NADPH-dependent ferric siderophore reductase
MPEYRIYPVRVVRTTRLGPHFVRLTFTGPDLAEFGYAGADQRVKILLPRPGRSLADLPSGADWYQRWRRLPDDIRPTMRTYTVRAFRPGDQQVDVDFVLHGMSDHDRPGPLSLWAGAAQPGDRVALLGPDRPGTGRLWGAEWDPPARTRRVLVAGDETAVPAIGAILERLSERLTGTVLAEVPTDADVPSWSAVPGVDVRWLVRERDGRDVARGVLLEEAVRGALAASHGRVASGANPQTDEDGDGVVLWDVPDPDHPSDRSEELFLWMAGEAGVMKRLRRLARHDHALPKSAVACMGYWRHGRPEPV